MFDTNKTGVYSCTWTTPTTEQSDWYFDIIVEDANPVQQDAGGIWHGYRRRFDSVGGCSNMPQLGGGGDVLLVDDYADAQRFAYYGLNGVMSNQPLPYSGFQDMDYFFQTTTNRTANEYPDVDLNVNDSSPFVPNNVIGGCQLWRVLSRGRLPRTR